MRINKLYLEAALKKLSDIRYRNKQLEEQRHSEIINKIPEYEILEKTLAQTMTDIVNSMLDKTPTTNPKTSDEKIKLVILGIIISVAFIIIGFWKIKKKGK